VASGSGSDWCKPERVLLVRQQAFRSAISEDFAEIQGLAVAAGSQVVCHISAVRKIPHPATFLGSGKVLEITELVKKLAVDVVILDHNATPVQERNLEQALHCRVIDRTRLILDIFALRARTSEASFRSNWLSLTISLPVWLGVGHTLKDSAVGWVSVAQVRHN